MRRKLQQIIDGHVGNAGQEHRQDNEVVQYLLEAHPDALIRASVVLLL